MSVRRNAWCFTAFLSESPSGEETSYLVYQREICPESGKEHWQGYAEFAGKKTLSAAQKALKIGKSHMEPRRGTPSEAANYCMKDDSRKPDTSFFESGTRRADPEPGKRNDLIHLRDAILNADNLGDVFMNDDVLPSLAKYGKFAERVHEMGLKRKTRDFRHVEVIVHWGDTGTGKTRGPYEEGAYKWNPGDAEWWDGYDGEKILLIDEFYGQIKPSRLLTLIDGYQCRLPIKCRFGYAQWEKVYITSNIHPDEWYTNLPEKVRGAIQRRIDKVVHFVAKPES